MEPVTFSTEDGVRLEGELRLPEGSPRASATICHPHPRHGGSKDHPILWAIRNELAHRGFAVLSFNFRGVMGSGGTYGGGRDEVRDAHAAIGRVRDEAPGLPSVVCGWSFGANVALREALDDERVAALALVGLPLTPGDVELPALPRGDELRGFRVPVLLLAGERDEFCPAEELRTMGTELRRARVEILAGTDHFLWRREREAAASIGDFVDGVVSETTR
ncbi:MAG: alpha/beta hydrolase [Actinomycetota bacterium]